MKKVLGTLVAMLLASMIILTGCSNGTSNDNEPGTNIEFTSIAFDDTYVSATSSSGVDDLTVAGKLAFWHDNNWCGSNVTVENLSVEENSVSYDFSEAGDCDYGSQYFYKMDVDGTYLITFTVKSSVAKTIKCNGFEYDLAADTETQISSLVLVSGLTTVINMQIPAIDGDSGTFALSNAKYASVSLDDLTLESILLDNDSLVLSVGDEEHLSCYSYF